jgi:hypothetical protein
MRSKLTAEPSSRHLSPRSLTHQQGEAQLVRYRAHVGSFQHLEGGIGNQGRVVRIGDTVHRPSSLHSRAIGELLAHLDGIGFRCAPVVLRSDGDGDIYRWIEGAVPVPPYPQWSMTDDVLSSVGRLLRLYHDAIASFVPSPDARWSSELSDPDGGPIICHNDVCPENVVFRGSQALALLDFDLAAPGRRVWDFATTARMWVPVRAPAQGNDRAHLDEFKRLRILADAYGMEEDDRRALVDTLIESTRIGGEFVRRRAQAGEQVFVQMWNARGGNLGERRALAWFEQNRTRFQEAVEA